ncbi:helix-turn-helix domain-containing protein [Cyclobacterium jeungdonense]|uniref:Helix-turn-helix transcriptional regulator n=1 Tax=Cyclobacterium jeungdonense TaxID=708087 RepID=A0ABT8C5C9_9BACT|nr:helix-turn-helix transcriptional regulator [Cyclobacterium jeungdonense]MDN3687239.1 helix-turn-helix transcriptional regulator [Cyclobacterium jeungdonense]
MNYLGNKLRELRASKGLLLRQVAAYIEVDTALVSKLERGERKAKRGHVEALAKIFKVNEKELITLWLADQVFDLVKDEEVANDVLKVAESELKYVKSSAKE